MPVKYSFFHQGFQHRTNSLRRPMHIRRQLFNSYLFLQTRKPNGRNFITRQGFKHLFANTLLHGIFRTKHSRCDAVLQNELYLRPTRFRIYRFFQEHFLHLVINSLHTFIELTSPTKFDQSSRNTRIARITSGAHIIQSHDIRQTSRTDDFKTIVIHRYTDIISGKCIITMNYGIYYALKPCELWIFRYRSKLSVIPKILKFSQKT